MLHYLISLLATCSICLAIPTAAGPGSWGKTKAYGGYGGNLFDDAIYIPLPPVITSVDLRGGERLDAITIRYERGGPRTHGGTGGIGRKLNVYPGDYVNAIRICTGKAKKSVRVTYLKMTTKRNQTVEGGQERPQHACEKVDIPEGSALVGASGQAADNIDQLAFYHARWL